VLGLGVLEVRHAHLAALAAGAAALVVRGLREWVEYRSSKSREMRGLRRDMDGAASYGEWLKAAGALDELRGMGDTSIACREGFGVFDPNLLESRTRSLRVLHARNRLDQVVYFLRGDLQRNAGNMADPRLYQHRYTTPATIREYVGEVVRNLGAVADYRGPALEPQDKVEFFTEARHAFGRTAIVLTGGGSLGTFHMGVCKALHEQSSLPRIFCGASAGAIVSAIICTRSDDELTETFQHVHEFDLNFFNFKTCAEYSRHFLRKGYAQDDMHIKRRLRALYGDMTFQEAYDRTGRILNVSVTAADTKEPPRLLNYLTAPHVVIWSAVAASAAFPLLFPATDILGKDVDGGFVKWGASHGHPGEARSGKERRWRDGSLEMDLPTSSLGILFNVNNFIVSQVNPQVSPILNVKSVVRRVFGATVADLLEGEVKHRSRQLLALLPPTGLSDFVRIMTQQWEGDVTIVIPSFWWSLSKLITDMTAPELRFMIDSGERQAFEHMPAVEVGMAVERALDRCLSQVQVEASGGRPRVSSRSRLSQQGGGGGPPGAGGRALGPTSRKARIPSWVHLQAMGIAAHKRSMSADKMAQEGTGDGWRDMNGRSGREPSARASTPSRPASPGSPTAQADDTDLADLDDEVAVAEALMQRKAHLWDPLLPGASEKYDCLSSLDVIAP